LIQSAAFNAAGYSEAILSARKDEVYGAVWIVNVPNAKSETDFFAIVSGSAGTLVSARTSAMPVEYRGADHRFARAIRVFAFDPAFEKYFKTRGAIRDIDNPYIQTSGKTEWNVTGNNVIGLFLGIAETMRSTH
jgi:hypothetical protein